MLAAGLVLLALALAPGWGWKASVFALGSGALALLVWRALLPDERQALRHPRQWRQLLRA